MTSLFCIAAPLTIPIGPIPLSPATLLVYLAGALMGRKKGTMAVGLYLLIGAAGLPVFSGFSGGIHKLAGVTGGYLIGYVVCAAMVGWAVERGCADWAAMLIGTAMCYALGTLWFAAQAGMAFTAALMACVIPFLPGDLMKIVAASMISREIKKRWDSRG